MKSALGPAPGALGSAGTHRVRLARFLPTTGGSRGPRGMCPLEESSCADSGTPVCWASSSWWQLPLAGQTAPPILGTWKAELEDQQRKDAPREVIVRADSSASWSKETVRWRLEARQHHDRARWRVGHLPAARSTSDEAHPLRRGPGQADHPHQGRAAHPAARQRSGAAGPGQTIAEASERGKGNWGLYSCSPFPCHFSPEALAQPRSNRRHRLVLCRDV